MPSYTYESIRRKVVRRVPCPVCGVKRYVRHTMQQTVNPFHPAVRSLDDPTYPAAYEAVRQAVLAEAEAWWPSQKESTHQKCLEKVADDA